MVRNKVTLGQGAAAQPKGTQSKTVAFAGCELDARCFNGIHEAKVVSRKKRRNAGVSVQGKEIVLWEVSNRKL